MNLKKIEEQGINLIKESMKENSPIDSREVYKLNDCTNVGFKHSMFSST